MEHHLSNAHIATVAIAIAMSALAVSAAGAAPASGSIAAKQWEDVRVTRGVRYDDLALATKGGRKALMRRVRTAVSELCPAYDEEGYALDAQYCSTFAWTRARPQIKRAVDLARSRQSRAMTIEITAAVAK
jgi:UrcA family protein